MRFILVFISVFLLISTSVFAEPGNDNSAGSKKKLLIADSPPGLQKKGAGFPAFLGSTPPGWNEGLKKGWNKNRDWRYNKNSKLWENKHWQWDHNTNSWIKSNGWGKHH